MLTKEFDLKRDIAKKYLIQAKGNVSKAYDLITESEEIREYKFS